MGAPPTIGGLSGVLKERECAQCERPHVRLGQEQTYAVHQPMSALVPIATAKADMPQKVMSALHPIADMCGALADVCFGPKADIG